MKKKYLLPFITLTVVSFLMLCTETFASDMNFSVEANIPENQLDKSQTYFDLRMKPGQVQDVSITIKNASDKSATFLIKPHIAVTNQNGVIDYSKDLPIDSTMKYAFTDIVTGETTYTLDAKETKKAVFHIKMPKHSYKGIILGGFQISKEQKENANEESKAVQIKNQYAYVIGMKLCESDDLVTPELTLNDVKPNLQNYRTVVTANLQNTQPVMITGLNVNAKISKKKNGEVLHKTEKQDMSMAPNSNFDFPVSWNNQELKAGTYYISIVAKDKKGHKWSLAKEFTIKGKDSKKLNKEAVELEKNYTLWIILVVISLIVVLLICWLIRRKKKEKAKKEYKKKRTPKKSKKNN